MLQPEKPATIEAWLEALGNPSADRDYKPGHARMQALLAGLELHRPGLRIRVAGTNGKGSTSFMLASALQTAGLKVGLYTSPHILSFNERIRINLEPISESQLLTDIEQLVPAALSAGASYFETATALALRHFSRERVDVEILEAGVGARLDATTAVPADMALITPIGLDHQAWLGETIAQVAEEKAHAMSACRHSISAPQSDPVVTALSAFNPGLHYCPIKAWQLAMPGRHQELNASLAIAAVQALQAEISTLELTAAQQAISDCVVPGRLQQMAIGEATVWLDAAHNRHAVEALLPALPALADPFDAIIVLTREDRSLDDCLPLLAPHCRQLLSRHDNIDAEQALEQALKEAPQGRFLMLGSFITVATILRTFVRT